MTALRGPKISAGGKIGTRLARMMSVMQPAGVRTFLCTNLGGTFALDNSKIVEALGMAFWPVEEPLRDAFGDLIASGKIKYKGAPG